MVLLERWGPGAHLCVAFRRMVVLLVAGRRGTRFRLRLVCFPARRSKGRYVLLALLRAEPLPLRALG